MVEKDESVFETRGMERFDECAIVDGWKKK